MGLDESEFAMMNIVPGFYWVIQYESSTIPTIARLTKSSGWEYMKSQHSAKMGGRGGPFKILSERLEYKE